MLKLGNVGVFFNHFALKTAKTLQSFGHFECKRVNVVKVNGYTSRESNSAVFILLPSISYGDNSLGKEFAFLEVNAIL